MKVLLSTPTHFVAIWRDENRKHFLWLKHSGTELAAAHLDFQATVEQDWIIVVSSLLQVMKQVHLLPWVHCLQRKSLVYSMHAPPVNQS